MAKNKNNLQLTNAVLEYYDKHKRQLPWRNTGNPYYVWLSEIMLQQTRVEAVKGYFIRFVEELPDIIALAECEEERLLKLWEGLGYYTRVRNLQKAARQIMQDYAGHLPQTKAELLNLAGIGDYTASAIASIAFGQREVALDGNLIRVFSRLFADDGDFTKQKTKQAISRRIEPYLPQERAGDFNQAIMDIGATICIPNGMPNCARCPLADYCLAKQMEQVMHFPRKKIKKVRKVEKRTILLFQKGEQILLRKRAEKGVLQGLWEFPNVLGHLSKLQLREMLEGELMLTGLSANSICEYKTATHIFSHLEWDMISYRIDISELTRLEIAEKIGDYSLFCENVRFAPLIESTNGQWVCREKLEQELSLPSAFKVFQQEFWEN